MYERRERLLRAGAGAASRAPEDVAKQVGELAWFKTHESAWGLDKDGHTFCVWGWGPSDPGLLIDSWNL